MAESSCSCPLRLDCTCGSRLRRMFEDNLPFNRVNLLRRTGIECSDDALLSSRTKHIWPIRSFSKFCEFNTSRQEVRLADYWNHVPLVDNFVLCERTYLATDKNLDLHLAISRYENDLIAVILINSTQDRALFTRLEFSAIKDGPEDTPTKILTYDMVCETGTNASRVLLMKRWSVMNLENRWLVNDTLKLSITASAKFLAGKPKLSKERPKHEHLVKDVDGWLCTLHLTDISIKASDGVEFRAHKAILTSRCEYFESMFNHEDVLESKQNMIEIADFSGNVVREMLRYLYTGEVYLDDCAVELLALSDKYNMKTLHGECEDFLARKVTAENALEVLHVAELYNAKNLAIKADDFILKNSIQVTSGDKTELGVMLKALDTETLGKLFSGIAALSTKKSKFVNRKSNTSTTELVANFNTLEHLRDVWVDHGGDVDSLRRRSRPARLITQSLRMEDVRMQIERWCRSDNA